MSKIILFLLIDKYIFYTLESDTVPRAASLRNRKPVHPNIDGGRMAGPLLLLPRRLQAGKSLFPHSHRLLPTRKGEKRGFWAEEKKKQSLLLPRRD